MLAVKLALTLNWEGDREGRAEERGKNLKKKSEVIDVLIN